jgi:hypothetical protein
MRVRVGEGGEIECGSERKRDDKKKTESELFY